MSTAFEGLCRNPQPARRRAKGERERLTKKIIALARAKATAVPRFCAAAY